MTDLQKIENFDRVEKYLNKILTMSSTVEHRIYENENEKAKAQGVDDGMMHLAKNVLGILGKGK